MEFRVGDEVMVDVDYFIDKEEDYGIFLRQITHYEGRIFTIRHICDGEIRLEGDEHNFHWLERHLLFAKPKTDAVKMFLQGD